MKLINKDKCDGEFNKKPIWVIYFHCNSVYIIVEKFVWKRHRICLNMLGSLPEDFRAKGRNFDKSRKLMIL